MADVIRNSDPQAMHDIAKEIRKYADGLKNDIQKLMNRHTNMNGSWSGEQYNSFTECVVQAKKKLEKQAAELQTIAQEVDKDAQALAAAQGVVIKN